MQDVNLIKENLNGFVEREFSLGASKEELSAILDQNNRAYYPTSHDIRNHMVSIELHVVLNRVTLTICISRHGLLVIGHRNKIVVSIC